MKEKKTEKERRNKVNERREKRNVKGRKIGNKNEDGVEKSEINRRLMKRIK